MKKVLFFYPDEKIGGGPYWLIRLATQLSQDSGYEVYYADYSNGFTHSMKERKYAENVTFLDYHDGYDKIFIPEPCIVFCPIYEIHKLPLLHPDSKILLHNWHNECLPVLKRVMNFSDKELSYFMSYIYARKAEVFVDGSHWIANNKLINITFPPSFVPLIMPKKNIRAPFSLINKNEINIAWIGRIVIDKVYALNNIIACANKYKTNKHINIHIIGDGPVTNLIDSNVNSNIHIKLCGRIVEDQLDEYLSKNIDVLFAMGTSCLEGAALGIPSIIVPTQMKKFYYDEFVFLPETIHYATGFEPHQKEEMHLKTVKFKDIIDDIYFNNKKGNIGQLCLNYINSFHSFKTSTDLLKSYLNTTELKYSDIKQFIRNFCVEYNNISKIVYTIKLFFIPLLKIIKYKYTDIYLFNFIPLLKIKKSNNKIKIKLFFLLQFLSLKIKK